MAYIPALVLQYNNDQYINGGVSPGTIKLIPTASQGGYVVEDVWAVPLTDGIVSSWQWVTTSPDSTDKPSASSVHAVKINSYNTSDSWIVLGTSTFWMQASADADCCYSPSFDMPTTISDIAACQALCANDDGNQFGVFGLPSPDGGTYTANGIYNDTALPEVTGATAAALVTALNLDASWFAIGTWAKTVDNLTLTVTGAAVSDPQDPNILCVIVTF